MNILIRLEVKEKEKEIVVKQIIMLLVCLFLIK